MELKNHIEQTFNVAELVAGYLKGELDERGQTELLDWINANEDNRNLFEKLCNEDNLTSAYALFTLFDENAALSKVRSNPDFITIQRKDDGKVRRLWPRIAVAASVAIAVMIGGYFYYDSQKQPVETVAHQKDIAPGKNGATLTLANGQKILINEAIAGNIANESGVKISKTSDGRIIYEISESNNGNLAYNTLSTTRGEQTQVRLPDGTLVFLNAESSLRYPTSFAGADKRQVSLTGEGYFEVAKDKVHPFIVESTGQKVEVLGTHFNINSYQDEDAIRTTLLEGSVKVVSQKTSQVIKPGEQAVWKQGLLNVAEVDVEEAVAWKNGLFKFNKTSLKAVMRQMARWYDVEVEYEGDVPDKLFTGEVYRNQNASQVLELLKFYNLNYRIENKKIIVFP